MFTTAATAEAEPPQYSSAQTYYRSAVEPTDAASVMLAAVPPDAQTHALVIGRHTIDPVVALIKSGCAAVQAQGITGPQMHPDPATLAWIADVRSEQELDSAVVQASHCLSQAGAIVVDASELAQPSAVVVALACLMKVGFRLRSVLHHGQRLILVATRRPQLAVVA